jgi:hypothetical protein
MAVFSFVKLGKKIFGKQKTTGKTTNPFERKKMRSDRAAKIGQLKVDLAKLKGGSKKLQTSIDEVRAAMREKARVKKMGGGFMGRRMGYSQGSNGKPVSRSKNPGLLKMSKSEKGKAVVKKFGYNPNRIVAKKGGKA